MSSINCASRLGNPARIAVGLPLLLLNLVELPAAQAGDGEASVGRSVPADASMIRLLAAPETSTTAPEQIPAGPAVPPVQSPAAQSGPTPTAQAVMAGKTLEVVEFRDQPLGDAMRLFSTQTGLNIVTSPEARKISVSVYLRNVTPEAALDAICKSHDLWHKQDPGTGVIRIYSAKEYQRRPREFPRGTDGGLYATLS